MAAGAIAFRQALAWAGLVMLLALTAMGLSLGVALHRADSLLNRLSRSQAQFAEAAVIQTDVDAYIMQPGPEKAARVRRRLTAYRQSIVEEAAASETSADATHQSAEAAHAKAIADRFETLVLAPSAANFEALRVLTAAVQDSEAAEADMSLRAMRRLQAAATTAAIGIPLVVTALGVGGFMLLSAGVVRPLRRLEQATGQGEPVEVFGFRELRSLGEAFNRMTRQNAAQRAALSAANRDLESQVAARTQEIEESRQRLTEVDAARRLFLSRISHELRTPATVVRGEAEVALRDPGADVERLREALRQVVANGAFLQRRLEDLLALALAEDGRLTVRRDVVDLGDLGWRVATLAKSYVRSNNVRLTVDMPPSGLPVTVLGDASWLQQAMLAVLDNAAKFAAGGNVRLSLDVQDGAATVAVDDDGPGVSLADLPHIFDSYRQTPEGREAGGAGLGLSVARWVIEQHGGVIAAAVGGAGGGLRIEMRLPTIAVAS